jgi:hypothetical protein
MASSMSGREWFLTVFYSVVGAGKIDDGLREHKGPGTTIFGFAMVGLGIWGLLRGFRDRGNPAAKDQVEAGHDDLSSARP